MVSPDKTNRSVSILRYLLILTTKNLKDVFVTEKLISSIREIIYEYFTKTQGEDTELISTYIHPNYIEINFQAIPTVNLSKLISNLKSVSTRYFLNTHPIIKEELAGGCWNQSYFLVTREQMVDSHIQRYIEEQFALRSVDRMIRN